MATTLAKVLSNVSGLQHRGNAALVEDFYRWMRENDRSEAYIKNNLKAVINFAQWLYRHYPDMSFPDVKRKEIILSYLDTKNSLADAFPCIIQIQNVSLR